MVTDTRLIMVIILKRIETASHYVVYQELTQYHRSILFPKNKQTWRKRHQVCGYQRHKVGGEKPDKGCQKVQTFSYKINRY